MPQSFAALYVHIVFSTKERRTLIDSEWQPDLLSYIGGIVRNVKGSLLRAGGMPDHVHLLCSLPRDLSTAEVVRTVKGNSSKWVHTEFPARQNFAWQSGYGAFSVSQSQLDVVKHYIDNQLEHHRKSTFADEFRALLQTHHLQWDERYVWD